MNDYGDRIATVIQDDPKKKVIRYSLRKGANKERVRQATPGRKGVEFVNHQGFAEGNPKVRVVRVEEPRIERSRSSYLNAQPQERVVRNVLPGPTEPVKKVKIMRNTQPPQVFGNNGSQSSCFCFLVNYAFCFSFGYTA